MKANSVRKLCNDACIAGYFRGKAWCETHPSIVLFAVCALLLLDAGADNAHAYDGKKFGTICKNAVELARGQFGAMMTAIAGVGAVIASAMGGFKMAWSLLVVSVGSFVLKAYITLFYKDCTS